MSTIVGFGEILFDLFPDYKRPGGSPFNVAFHAKTLKNDGVIVSRVGSDENGDDLMAFLSDKGMPADFVQRDSSESTGVVNVTFKGSEPSYEIVEPAAWDFIEWNSHLETLAKRTNALCFATLAQRNEATHKTLIQFLKSMPKVSLKLCDVNLRPPFFDRQILSQSMRLANAVKVNHHELAEISQLFGLDGRPQNFRAHFELSHLFLTKGKEGSALFTAEGEFHHGGHRVDASSGDAVGVGDAFTACLIHHLVKETPPQGMLDKANRYAAFVVTQKGATPDVPESIMSACQ